jgi:hypothetical protein
MSPSFTVLEGKEETAGGHSSLGGRNQLGTKGRLCFSHSMLPGLDPSPVTEVVGVVVRTWAHPCAHLPVGRPLDTRLGSPCWVWM